MQRGETLQVSSEQQRERGVAELFRTRRQPMARLAYVLTHNGDLADEIVQDAFLRLHANWAGVEQPSAYLRRAVVNGCHSHHRHLAVVRRTPIEPATPAPAADHATTDDRLTAALAELSFDHRTILALRYFCDLDDVEIATTLGIGRATVRTRAHRALDRLRKELVR